MKNYKTQTLFSMLRTMAYSKSFKMQVCKELASRGIRITYKG